MDEDWIGRVTTSCMLLPWFFLHVTYWQVCRVTRRCHAFGVAIRTTQRCLGHYRRLWARQGWIGWTFATEEKEIERFFLGGRHSSRKSKLEQKKIEHFFLLLWGVQEIFGLLTNLRLDWMQKNREVYTRTIDLFSSLLKHTKNPGQATGRSKLMPGFPDLVFCCYTHNSCTSAPQRGCGAGWWVEDHKHSESAFHDASVPWSPGGVVEL